MTGGLCAGVCGVASLTAVTRSKDDQVVWSWLRLRQASHITRRDAGGMAFVFNKSGGHRDNKQSCASPGRRGGCGGVAIVADKDQRHGLLVKLCTISGDGVVSTAFQTRSMSTSTHLPRQTVSGTPPVSAACDDRFLPKTKAEDLFALATANLKPANTLSSCSLYTSPRASLLSTLQVKNLPALAYLLNDSRAIKTNLCFLADSGCFNSLYCPHSPIPSL